MARPRGLGIIEHTGLGMPGWRFQRVWGTEWGPAGEVATLTPLGLGVKGHPLRPERLEQQAGPTTPVGPGLGLLLTQSEWALTAWSHRLRATLSSGRGQRDTGYALGHGSGGE